jgi:ATP-dependent DNA helicase PIF1
MSDQVTAQLKRLSLQTSESRIILSDEQEQFVNLAVEEGKNLLLVAPAGYGKSAVIKTILRRFNLSLSRVKGHPVCALCAPTGKAASLIEGRTLHSYLGIGLGRGSVTDWLNDVIAKTRDDLKGVQAILIDEISMVSGVFLSKISEYLAKIRGNTKPFGGVQMILIGDLCQLPPVKSERDFVFLSDEYVRGKFQAFQLTKCFRQDDSDFVALLNEVRFARCSEKTMETLRNRTSIDPEYANGQSPMRIASKNEGVDAVNERELRKYVQKSDVEVIRYSVRIFQGSNRSKVEEYQKEATIPDVVKIAIGCPVVVTQYLGQGIVNGTEGFVTAAGPDRIQLRLKSGNTATIKYVEYKNLFTYMPVRLGYASTVHKAQGMTLKLLEVDFQGTFAHGQIYTALSRVTDLRGLIVKNLTPNAFRCDEVVREFYESLN